MRTHDPIETFDLIAVPVQSVVDAVQCAVDIQKGMAKRNADEPDDQRIVFRRGPSYTMSKAVRTTSGPSSADTCPWNRSPLTPILGPSASPQSLTEPTGPYYRNVGTSARSYTTSGNTIRCQTILIH